MRDYEIVLIFHPELEENSLTEALERVKGWITNNGGSIQKEESWGTRKLSYLIRKQKTGQYFLLQANLVPASITEFEQFLRLTEPIIRYMITVIE